MEPTREQIERGAAALIPFVQEWDLAVNPEDLDEMVYAVLVHHDSAGSWDEIDRAVRDQIADIRRGQAEMLEAMRREHDQQ
jgi:hypothetical protein